MLPTPPTLLCAGLPISPVGLHQPGLLGKHVANFSSFNPSILWDDDQVKVEREQRIGLRVYFRVSNMHFCPGGPWPRQSWKDAVREQGDIVSYIGAARLVLARPGFGLPFELASAVKVREDWPRLLEDTSRLFRLAGGRCEDRARIRADGLSSTFSGVEDPRAFWSVGPEPRAPWLLVSAWSDDCIRLGVNLVKLPPLQAAETPSVRATVTAAGVADSTADATVNDDEPIAPTQVPLIVEDWPEDFGLPHPAGQRIQKNWLPFTRHDELLVQ